ncbi:MAG: TAXI family TRAP transporter solute-binding subunit [Desulfobacterales bacterium]|nr:TAXI family TRAP transporter solute-binding subunit [Desulfobacterales bacterium]
MKNQRNMVSQKNLAGRVLTWAMVVALCGLMGTTVQAESLAIGTTSVGSAPYVVSVGIAEMITRDAGISVTVESSGGADAIARLLGAGKVQLGMLNSFAAEHAFKGDFQFKKTGKIPVRALIWGNASLRQPVATKASGIKTIADFKDKRILGRRKVGRDTILVFEALIKAYGLKDTDMKVMTYSRPNEIMDAFKGRVAHAAIWPASAPNPLILQLQETVELSYPSIPKDKWDEVLGSLGPAFFMASIKPNTYKNQPEEIFVPGIQMGLSTVKTLPEDAGYKITKALMGNYDKLKAYHPTARDWTLEATLQQWSAPFHPGAVKYFKEIGAWTSDMDKKQSKVLSLELSGPVK